jgi:hypothetical protein
VGASIVAYRFTYEVTIGCSLDIVQPTQYMSNFLSGQSFQHIFRPYIILLQLIFLSNYAGVVFVLKYCLSSVIWLTDFTFVY